MKYTLKEFTVFACLVLAFAVLPFLAQDYAIGVGLAILMWLALTQSWAVLSSMTGYISLGQVVFYGIGSYVVVVTWQWMPLGLALIMAGAISALFALVVGLPAMRVRGPYFVILTFGLAELVKYSLMAIEAKMGISSRLLFGTPPIETIYWIVLVLAVASTLLLETVHRSPFGHGLRSLRENEEAAETLGVPVARYKLIAFILSAIIPGMVGGVMALRSSYFEATQAFDPMISITVIVMAILGGGDNARGPLFGVVFLVILSELLWTNAPQFYMIILGILLIVFVVKLPNGLLGWYRNYKHRAQGEGS